jgi:orotidine-5'-phosphate decarboxylase
MADLTEAASRVIVALDVEDAASARQLVQSLGRRARIYKVGLQLLTAGGPQVIEELRAAGKEVFLDLKLYEIPNSVDGAVRAAGKLGVSMVTVHASAGAAIVRAAVDAARSFPGMKVLALTVVTSMDAADLAATGVAGGVEQQVLRLARLAVDNGCDGLIAGPNEVARLRAQFGPDRLMVTPGIALAGECEANLARSSTPFAAIAAGASHVMLGRAICQAPDPAAQFDAVCAEVARAAGA